MVHFVFLVVLIIGGLNAYIYFYDKKAQKEELRNVYREGFKALAPAE